ncbi:MAG: hypothetical protein LAP38_02015 [Acidobacteriia bacterium]|nr:hypothetical protein [Terriglobia bacterium]
MAQAESSFVDPRQATAIAPATAAESEATAFRFSVTWSLLSAPVDPPRAVTSLIPMNERAAKPALAGPKPDLTPAPASLPAARIYADQVLQAEGKNIRHGGAFQWEMVVPKMVRPGKKAKLTSAIAPPATPRRPPAPPEPQNAPNLYTGSTPFRKSSSFKLCLGVLALAAIAVPVWQRASRSAGTQVDTSINGGDWMRQAAVQGDPGVKSARQLILYRPALTAHDGRLEFNWKVDDQGVGWVFRAKDLGNYYAMQLKVVRPGSSPAVGLEYFTVYNWLESGHTEKVLILSSNDRVLHVRMDIFGPMFTLYLQGNATEYWNDARLTSGALGFLEEWNQTADVQTVRLSFPERSSVQRGLRVPQLPAFFAAGGPGMALHSRPAAGGA